MTLTSDKLEKIRSTLRSARKLREEEASLLLEEIDRLRQESAAGQGRETIYLEEIDRLNSLLWQLVEYVDTIADVVGDTEVTDDSTPADIKRKAVNLIIQSVREMKK